MTRTHPWLRWTLALALAASTQGFLFVQASFAVNQEWIAATLCANPGTDCDGHCVLAERMGHDHDHGPTEVPATLELALSVRPLVAEAPRLAPPRARAFAHGVAPGLGPASGLPAEVFRPPRTA